jgi:iron complex transport system ATP-binding protein
MDRVRDLAQTGIAVFVTMHDLNLAAAYADHLAVLKSGCLVAQGRPGDVLTTALLADVFCIDSGIGQAPPAGTAFFLPHLHAAKQGNVWRARQT